MRSFPHAQHMVLALPKADAGGKYVLSMDGKVGLVSSGPHVREATHFIDQRSNVCLPLNRYYQATKTSRLWQEGFDVSFASPSDQDIHAMVADPRTWDPMSLKRWVMSDPSRNAPILSQYCATLGLGELRIERE